MFGLKFFFSGFISAIIALLLIFSLSILIADKNWLENVSYVIILAFLEESSKFFVLRKLFSEFEKFNLFFNVILFSLGFSFFEIFFNSLGLETFSKEMLIAYSLPALLHIVTSLILAWFLFFKRKSLRWNTSALFFSLALHSLFNLLIFYDFSPWKIGLFLVIILSITSSLFFSCQRKNFPL